MFALPFVQHGDCTHSLGWLIELGRALDVGLWWRVSEDAIPRSGKICDTYVNASLVKADAVRFGFDQQQRFVENDELRTPSTNFVRNEL